MAEQWSPNRSRGRGFRNRGARGRGWNGNGYYQKPPLHHPPPLAFRGHFLSRNFHYDSTKQPPEYPKQGGSSNLYSNNRNHYNTNNYPHTKRQYLSSPSGNHQSSKPPSPLPGSEEYIQREISEKSAFLKHHLALEVPESKFNSESSFTADDTAENFCDSFYKFNNNSNTSENCNINSDNVENINDSQNQPRKKSTTQTPSQENLSVEDVHNKIINHIAKLSYSKKFNIVNNASGSSYDLAIHEINKQKRQQLSNALRDLCDDQLKQNEDSSKIINSIIPDFDIKIEVLPKEFVEQLSETLNVNFSDCIYNSSVDPELLFQQAADMLNTTMDIENADFTFPSFQEIDKNDPGLTESLGSNLTNIEDPNLGFSNSSINFDSSSANFDLSNVSYQNSPLSQPPPFQNLNNPTEYYTPYTNCNFTSHANNAPQYYSPQSILDDNSLANHSINEAQPVSDILAKEWLGISRIDNNLSKPLNSSGIAPNTKTPSSFDVMEEAKQLEACIAFSKAQDKPNLFHSDFQIPLLNSVEAQTKIPLLTPPPSNNINILPLQSENPQQEQKQVAENRDLLKFRIKNFDNLTKSNQCLAIDVNELKKREQDQELVVETKDSKLRKDKIKQKAESKERVPEKRTEAPLKLKENSPPKPLPPVSNSEKPAPSKPVNFKTDKSSSSKLTLDKERSSKREDDVIREKANNVPKSKTHLEQQDKKRYAQDDYFKKQEDKFKSDKGKLVRSGSLDKYADKADYEYSDSTRYRKYTRERDDAHYSRRYPEDDLYNYKLDYPDYDNNYAYNRQTYYDQPSKHGYSYSSDEYDHNSQHSQKHKHSKSSKKSKKAKRHRDRSSDPNIDSEKLVSYTQAQSASPRKTLKERIEIMHSMKHKRASESGDDRDNRSSSRPTSANSQYGKEKKTSKSPSRHTEERKNIENLELQNVRVKTEKMSPRENEREEARRQNSGETKKLVKNKDESRAKPSKDHPNTLVNKERQSEPSRLSLDPLPKETRAESSNISSNTLGKKEAQPEPPKLPLANKESRVESPKVSPNELINEEKQHGPPQLLENSLPNNQSQAEPLHLPANILPDKESQSEPLHLSADTLPDKDSQAEPLYLPANTLSDKESQVEPLHLPADTLPDKESQAELLHLPADTLPDKESQAELLHLPANTLPDKESQPELLENSTNSDNIQPERSQPLLNTLPTESHGKPPEISSNASAETQPEPLKFALNLNPETPASLPESASNTLPNKFTQETELITIKEDIVKEKTPAVSSNSAIENLASLAKTCENIDLAVNDRSTLKSPEFSQRAWKSPGERKMMVESSVEETPIQANSLEIVFDAKPQQDTPASETEELPATAESTKTSVSQKEEVKPVQSKQTKPVGKSSEGERAPSAELSLKPKPSLKRKSKDRTSSSSPFRSTHSTSSKSDSAKKAPPSRKSDYHKSSSTNEKKKDKYKFKSRETQTTANHKNKQMQTDNEKVVHKKSTMVQTEPVVENICGDTSEFSDRNILVAVRRRKIIERMFDVDREIERLTRFRQSLYNYLTVESDLEEEDEPITKLPKIKITKQKKLERPKAADVPEINKFKPIKWEIKHQEEARSESAAIKKAPKKTKERRSRDKSVDNRQSRDKSVDSRQSRDKSVEPSPFKDANCVLKIKKVESDHAQLNPTKRPCLRVLRSESRSDSEELPKHLKKKKKLSEMESLASDVQTVNCSEGRARRSRTQSVTEIKKEEVREPSSLDMIRQKNIEEIMKTIDEVVKNVSSDREKSPEGMENVQIQDGEVVDHGKKRKRQRLKLDLKKLPVFNPEVESEPQPDTKPDLKTNEAKKSNKRKKADLSKSTTDIEETEEKQHKKKLSKKQLAGPKSSKKYKKFKAAQLVRAKHVNLLPVVTLSRCSKIENLLKEVKKREDDVITFREPQVVLPEVFSKSSIVEKEDQPCTKEGSQIDVPSIALKTEPLPELGESSVSGFEISRDANSEGASQDANLEGTTNEEKVSRKDADAMDSEDYEINFTGFTGAILVVKVIDSVAIAASDKGKLLCFSMQTGELMSSHDISVLPITSMIAANKNNDNLLYIGSLDSSITIMNFDTKEQIKVEKLEEPVQCMEHAWNTLFIGSARGSLIRYDLTKMEVDEETKISDYNVLTIKATQEGPRKVLVIATRNAPVSIRDARSGLLLRTMETPFLPTVYTLLFDKNQIYCGTSQHDILVYTFEDGQLVFKHEATKSKGVVCMQIVGNLLFAGCYNGNIYVYNTNTNIYLGTMSGPGGLMLSMEIVKNKIIVGTKSSNFKAWNIPQKYLDQI